MNKFLCAQLTLCVLASACSPHSETVDAGDAGVSLDAALVDSGAACDPSTCASGHCAPDGGCAASCSGSTSCSSSETCCSATFCTDVTKDPQNCGSCGAACGPQQFCVGTGCNEALVMNVCQNAAGDVVMDGIAVDESAGSVVANALSAGCSAMTLATITQGAASSMDPSNGRPLIGVGMTYVATGGSFGQKSVAYMNTTRNAPVYSTDDSQNVAFVRSSDSSTIVSSPIANLTAHHDYFLVYVAVEPVSGTLVFAVYGLYSSGTAAGAYWFSTQATTLAALSKQYYVYEWTDTNNDGTPNSADAFALLDSK